MTVHRALVFGAATTILASASLYATLAQTKAPLAFEVASIKPNAANDNRVSMQRAPGGRVMATGISLRMLMRNAYRIQDFQIVGGPDWMSSDRWDVQAKSEENATQAQVDEMMQTLLADRFKLRFHKETRELPTYALVVAKNGPKLQESQLDTTTTPSSPAVAVATRGGPQPLGRGMVMVNASGGKMQLAGGAMSMSQLAQMLGNTLGRIVLDQTGLKGAYDIKLEYSPEPGQRGPFGGGAGGPAGGGTASSDDPNVVSIFTAIQEQLGLKIESTKGPVEVFVIDGAEKPLEP
jgi:uncharacterized protein (TIGR03435 family)